MSVTGPATTLQAILNQIQAPARPPGAVRPATQAATAPAAAATRHAAGPIAPTPSSGVAQNGGASFNPNAPRGSYLNIVV